ncbi:MAG: pyridoxamine 5'-phosphate oxidase [Ignavibacteriales bacterium]|nr:pyridoxamine 5'-phosphate oxidase [Ignavibacteriales bacterium]
MNDKTIKLLSSPLLDENNVKLNPFDQFEIWMQDATKAKVFVPTAMTLATSTKEGKPSARIVLLKKVDERGFIFFTNYQSKKGKQLSVNPNAALVFHWKELERQIRIEGSVRKILLQESDEYFNSRPLLSRISSIISPQSEIVPDRNWLVKHFKEKEFESIDRLVRPQNWGGYCLKPTAIEFWQGGINRLHDRILYKKQKSGWKIVRLAP